VGGSGGNSTFQSRGTGDYTFTGKGSGNTLDYSADTSALGVTIDLTTDTALLLLIMRKREETPAPASGLVLCSPTAAHRWYRG
jgi:hypothetical protein